MHGCVGWFVGSIFVSLGLSPVFELFHSIVWSPRLKRFAVVVGVKNGQFYCVSVVVDGVFETVKYQN